MTLAAVEFFLDAVQIEDVRRAGDLAAELLIGDLTGARYLPEPQRAVGLLRAQVFGELALAGNGAGWQASRSL